MNNSRIDYTIVGALFALVIFVSMTLFLSDFITVRINTAVPEEPKEPEPIVTDLNKKADLWVKLLSYTYDPNLANLFEGEAESEDAEDISDNTGDGRIIRKTYAYTPSSSCVMLDKGGFMRNDTDADILELTSQQIKSPVLESVEEGEPLVLIMHTHTTECYMPEERLTYTQNDPQRSLTLSETVVSVGEEIAEQLRQSGIGVIHDKTVHDYPSYSGAYDRSQRTVLDYLSEYPSIQIVIDVHRDAIESDGIRYAPVAEINGKQAAQVMIIVGNHNVPRYRYNLRLGLALQSKMEQLYPTLTRPLTVADRNYNQELTKGSILVEMGSSANSLEEARYAGELVGISLAQLIGELLS